jgi:protoheme IX farnesyltransferase
MMQRIKAYYSLMKPGVMYGNVMTTLAGFLLASQGHVNGWLFGMTVLGSTLVIGSACVINNYFDQDIDRVMERTKKRAIVSGLVPAGHAAAFGVAAGLLGFLLLAAYTNWLVVALAVIGFVDYVWLYGMWSKRQSVHGTLVGSISGAIPIMLGYCAVTGRIDVGAILVFAVLFFWQMPEFYSIAIYRRTEYQAAHVPVITVVKGVEHTKREILAYTAAFVAATLLLSAAGVTGVVYSVIMAILGGYWLWLGWQGLTAKDNDRWARRMFRFSLVMLLAFSVLISVEAWLP